MHAKRTEGFISVRSEVLQQYLRQKISNRLRWSISKISAWRLSGKSGSRTWRHSSSPTIRGMTSLTNSINIKYLVPVQIPPVFNGVLPDKLPVNVAVDAINEVYLLELR